MTDWEFSAKIDEVDRLLNDPEGSMRPARVWELLEQIRAHAGDFLDANGHAITPDMRELA